MKYEVKTWTDDEIAVIKDTTLTSKECAEKLGRTKGSVCQKRQRLGIKTPDMRKKRKRWTNDEINVVRDKHLKSKECAEILGKTVPAVNNMRQRLKNIKN
jgi:hypothetical protein